MRTVRTLIAGVALALLVPAAAMALGSVGYVNVSGTVPGGGGGNKILVELKNANNAVVGSSTYTTGANDTEEHIANKLRDNFAGAGFAAHRMKDKNDGTEVIEFHRKRDGGQNFDIVVTNAEASVTVQSKSDGTDNKRSASISPTHFGGDTGDPKTGILVLTGTGTNWSNANVAGIDPGDYISVNSFTVDSPTQITANVSWSFEVGGPEHVVVIIHDVDSEAGPIDDVDVVSTQELDLSPPLPALGAWGIVALCLLLATSGLVVARRRSDARPA